MQKSKLNTKQMLRLLLEIQEYDSKLLELQMRKDFFPGLLKSLEDQIVEIEKEFEEKSTRLRELKKEISMLEIELQEERDGLAKSQEKLMKVTTNKEYDAVQAEIATHEERIAKIEERLIILMDEEDSLSREVADLEVRAKEVKERNTKRIEEIKKSAGQIDSIIAQIKADRDRLAKLVDQRILRRYEQIRRGTQGVAVVGIVNRACGGCMQALPPQIIQDIRAGKIIVCQNCGRIIVDLNELMSLSLEEILSEAKK